MRTTFFTFALLGISLLFHCQPNDPQPVTGMAIRVLDGQTGNPLPDVQVRILDSGPSGNTGTDGSIRFERTELAGYEIAAITDSVAYAVSVRINNFQPRELNIAEGTTEVRLLPDSSGQYFYTQPVQLNDGLTSGHLLQANLDTALLQQLMVKITQPGYRDLHSLLIYKDDRLVLEEYYFGNNDSINFEGGVTRDRSPAPIWWTRTEKHYVASVNKAITATLTGIALDQKGIATSAYLKDYLPTYQAYFNGNPNKSGVTFHHALNMMLGYQWDEWGSNDLVQLWKSDDFAAFLFNRINRGPGTTWVYNSASPNVLIKCLDEMLEKPVREWADDAFFGKLGISDYKWQSQPDGYPEGAARMYLRPRDMLKIGVTYLNDGIWDGEQVIPADWVARCHQPQATPDAGIYSHGFWIRRLNGITYLSADGDGGNYINIFPAQNMVIVITQGNYLQWPLYVNQANDMMGKFILPAVR